MRRSSSSNLGSERKESRRGFTLRARYTIIACTHGVLQVFESPGPYHPSARTTPSTIVPVLRHLDRAPVLLGPEALESLRAVCPPVARRRCPRAFRARLPRGRLYQRLDP